VAAADVIAIASNGPLGQIIGRLVSNPVEGRPLRCP
jgi:hypothetical protein